MQCRHPNTHIGEEFIDLFVLLGSMAPGVRQRALRYASDMAPVYDIDEVLEAVSAFSHDGYHRCHRRVLPVAEFPVWLTFRVFECLPDADLAQWTAVNRCYRVLAGGILRTRPREGRKPFSGRWLGRSRAMVARRQDSSDFPNLRGSSQRNKEQ